LESGLPDGIFSKQFGNILEGFGMEKVGIFYGLLEYPTDNWYILWQLGNIFPCFGILCQEKSGSPAWNWMHSSSRGTNLKRGSNIFPNTYKAKKWSYAQGFEPAAADFNETA
jgi:hypothetical protein